MHYLIDLGISTKINRLVIDILQTKIYENQFHTCAWFERSDVLQAAEWLN